MENNKTVAKSKGVQQKSLQQKQQLHQQQQKQATSHIEVGRISVVVGIDTNGNVKTYRTLLVEYKKKSSGEVDWNFKPIIFNEEQLIQAIGNGWIGYNIGIDKGRIKFTTGDPERFKEKNGHRAFVIIAQTLNSNGKIIGYIICNYDGKVNRVSLKQLISYAISCSKNECVPVQNAMFYKETNERAAHFKAFKGSSFITETIIINKNQYAEQRKVDTKQNQKTLNKSKLEQIYTPEQLKQLKLGKVNGVNIKIYANPKLSAEQMKTLRKGLMSGVNVSPFAHPDYKVEVMKFYIAELECKMRIDQFLNPKYSLDQIGILSLVVEEGLDISKLSDPSIPAYRMEEIRQRLKAGLFHEMKVNGKMQMVI